MQFDRLIGNFSAPASILYADITSPEFGHFHKTLAKTAREGKTSYRLRHKKGGNFEAKPLIVPGYGVQLSLKRTDYIVIDDRNDEENKAAKPVAETEVKFEDTELADLKPLSASEVLDLSLKASSFIVQGENPFDTLVKLSQDFPKYSGAVASHTIGKDFLAEHRWNREKLVPAGINVWWMNGVQLTERQIDGLTLLDILRKERKLINGVRALGFTGGEAIDLLANNEIASVNAGDEPQRYDWRDEIEGGKVLIWMNNLEKDKRYAEWPSNLQAVSHTTITKVT